MNKIKLKNLRSYNDAILTNNVRKVGGSYEK
jgi:hypothetical protein